jgi:hypothetical protein
MSEIVTSMICFVAGITLACTIYNGLVLNKLLNEYTELLKQYHKTPQPTHQEIFKQPHQSLQVAPETAAAKKLSVPTLDPQMISKNLANPPKPKGGFGTSVDGV